MTRFRLLMMSAALIPFTAASGQDAPPPGYDDPGPPPGYNDQGPPPGYNDQGPPPGYNDQGPPPGYNDQGPPPGYGEQGPPPGSGDQGPPPGYGNDQGPPPGYQGGSSGYDDQGPPPGYDDQGPPPGYADGPPPPSGYDGSQPPPPPGYRPEGEEDAQPAQDERYASYAERWAEDNCVKAHGNVGEGAAIGGVVGAIIGSGMAGRHDRGAGLLVGGALGAAGGAAIAASSGSDATSPGCPPGFVVRNGAPRFSYGETAFVYDAPQWYRPWYYSGGHWLYRPYPYHAWYCRRYHGGGDRWRGRTWRGDGGHRPDWDRHDR
jgi:hypothetical protein